MADKKEASTATTGKSAGGFESKMMAVLIPAIILHVSYLPILRTE